MMTEDDLLAEWERKVAQGKVHTGAMNFTPTSKILQERMKLKKHQAEMLDRLKPDLAWVDEAHHIEEGMGKIAKSSMHAASLLERMAAKFTLNFKNMDDVKYRVFGNAYLEHQLAGVSTGRYYDSGVHILDGNEAVNMMRSKTGHDFALRYGTTGHRNWSGRGSAKSSYLQSKAVDYIGFIAELKQLITAGYTISVIALKIMDFFNVGTNTITYSAASYIARRLHDLIYLLDGGDVNNRFWRSMAVVQLFIKSGENEHQHVGYASDTDLRGLATTCARHPTFTVANQAIMSNNIDNAYRSYYA